MLDITAARGLSEEQRLMRESCRAFVDDDILSAQTGSASGT
jgi:hypothetical protein